MKLFELFGDIKLNDDSVESKIDKIDKKAKSTGKDFDALGSKTSKLGSMLSNAFSFATGQIIFKGIDAITNSLKSGIEAGMDYNSSMQQNRIAFEVLTKSGEKAEQMMKDLSTMAANTPFELPQLTDAAKTLLAFGFNAQQATKLMTPLGDAASANGKRSAEALGAIAQTFGQIQTAGKLTTQDLKQLTNWGIGAFEILAKQTGKTTEQVQKMVTDGLIPADEGIRMLAEGIEKDFGGMMERQSKSFEGLMSTLKDNVISTIGGLLMPTFENISNRVLPNVIDKVNVFSNAVNNGQTPIQALTTMISDIFGVKVADTFTKVMTAGNDLKDAALKLEPIVSSIFRYFVDVIVPKLASFAVDNAPKIKQIFGDINDVLLKLEPVLQTLNNVLLQEAIRDFSDLLTVISGVTGALNDLLNFNWTGLGNKLKSIASPLGNISNVLNIVKNPVGALGSFISGSILKSGSTNKNISAAYSDGGYASGTDNATQGWHLVGEQGVELMYFNGGEKVVNHENTEKALGGITINIQNFVNERKQDVQAFAEELEFYRRQRAIGGAY